MHVHYMRALHGPSLHFYVISLRLIFLSKYNKKNYSKTMYNIVARMQELQHSK